jgi:hypothetical protein
MATKSTKKTAQSLLQKAKSYTGAKTKMTKELRELTMAFLGGEINITQASHALGKKAGSGSVYITLLNAAKELWNEK